MLQIKIKNPIEYLVMNKDGDKVYLTANVFYALTGDIRNPTKQSMMMGIIRKKNIIDRCKNWLFAQIGEQKAWGGHWLKLEDYPLELNIKFINAKTGTWDIDNKGYFWGKIFQDLMVEKGAILKDNVKHIAKVSYEYEFGNVPEIVFTLSHHDRTGIDLFNNSISG